MVGETRRSDGPSVPISAFGGARSLPAAARDRQRADLTGTASRYSRGWVVFLTNVLYPCHTGGIEIFHYYFAKALSAHFPLAVLAECDRRFPEFRIRLRDIRSPFGRLQTLFTLAHHVDFVWRNRDRIGLIHIPYSSGHFFQYYHVMALARRYGIPYILRLSSGHMQPAHPDWLHKIYFRHAAARIGVSEMISEEYERRYGYPVETIHSYLPFLRPDRCREELRAAHQVPPNDLVFLYLSTLKAFKGPDVLVAALQRLGAEFLRQHRVYVLFVGGGDLLEPLRSRIVKLGLADRVQFTGNVPHERVHEYYALSDVFVMPSLAEARPLALSEALFNGLPAIASDITVIATMIENERNGLLFPKGDAQILANHIRAAAQTPALRERLARGAQAGREHYDQFTAMVEHYRNLYDRLMSDCRINLRRRNHGAP